MARRASSSPSWQRHLNELLGEVRMAAVSFGTRLGDLKTARSGCGEGLGWMTKGPLCRTGAAVQERCLRFPIHFWALVLPRNPSKRHQDMETSTSNLPPPFSYFMVNARSKRPRSWGN